MQTRWAHRLQIYVPNQTSSHIQFGKQTTQEIYCSLRCRIELDFFERIVALAREYATHGHLEGAEESALDWLIGTPLTPDRRRNLLSRLQRPDYPNLVKLIAAEVAYRSAPNKRVTLPVV